MISRPITCHHQRRKRQLSQLAKLWTLWLSVFFFVQNKDTKRVCTLCWKRIWELFTHETCSKIHPRGTNTVALWPPSSQNNALPNKHNKLELIKVPEIDNNYLWLLDSRCDYVDVSSWAAQPSALPIGAEKEAACTPPPRAMLINLQSEERHTPEADWCSLRLLQERGFVAHTDPTTD